MKNVQKHYSNLKDPWISVKEIEKMMEESTQVSRDCNQNEAEINRKIVQGLKTFCPLLRKDNVIRSV